MELLILYQINFHILFQIERMKVFHKIMQSYLKYNYKYEFINLKEKCLGNKNFLIDKEISAVRNDKHRYYK